jgi:cation:H+ antiporter
MFSRLVEKKEIHIKNHMAEIKTIEIVKSVSYVLISVAFVIIGAYITTDSAIKIAGFFGLAESIIGASILAVGTTLPELSVNVSAIRRGNVSLAIGDTIGSIVTNLTLILGIALIINPITFAGVGILLLSLIFVNLLFMLFSTRMKFDKIIGIILLIIYAVYLMSLFLL